MSSFLWRTADTCVPLLQYKGTQVSAPRFPLQSFYRYCFVPAVFFRLPAPKTALAYMRGKKDFCFNRCPKNYRPYFCLLLTYSRNLFCEKRVFLLAEKIFFNTHHILHPRLLPLSFLLTYKSLFKSLLKCINIVHHIKSHNSVIGCIQPKFKNKTIVFITKSC